MDGCHRLLLVADSAEQQRDWHEVLANVASALRNRRRLSDAPGVLAQGLSAMGGIASRTAAAGLGWEVGRNAGNQVSRALGLR